MEVYRSGDKASTPSETIYTPLPKPGSGKRKHYPQPLTTRPTVELHKVPIGEQFTPNEIRGMAQVLQSLGDAPIDGGTTLSEIRDLILWEAAGIHFPNPYDV